MKRRLHSTADTEALLALNHISEINLKLVEQTN